MNVSETQKIIFSIILPIYKVEDYLPDCLSALYNQDIPECNYEIICVNDGSPDSCGRIIADFSSRHDNIIVVNQENQGVSAARNAGLQIAKGEYIWFIDPDDVIVPNCFSFLEDYVRQTPLDMILFQVYRFHRVFTDKEKQEANTHTLTSNVGWSGIFGRLIRKHIIDTNHLRFHTDLIVSEDRIFLAQLAECVKTVAQIDDVIYCYRQQPSSITHTHNEEVRLKKLRSHIIAAEIVLNIYNQQEIKKQSTAEEVMKLIWLSLADIASHNNYASMEYLRMMKEKKLFPIKRLPESQKITSLYYSRKGFVGRIVNYLTIHSHTIFGFMMLRIWYFITNIIKRKQ